MHIGIDGSFGSQWIKSTSHLEAFLLWIDIDIMAFMITVYGRLLRIKGISDRICDTNKVGWMIDESTSKLWKLLNSRFEPIMSDQSW